MTTEPEPTASPLKETHKELYGMLLVINQRIKNVGTSLIWFLGVAVLALCVAIHMRWIENVFGIPAERLRGFGVYALLVVVAFVLFALSTQFREQQIYRAAKPDILRSLKDNGISTERLLAEIADDGRLEAIREKLMDDRSLRRDGPYGVSRQA